MPLVASVADAVSIPVVAAGGIADARGIAAALCLGASGVWMGTRFVATKESAAHPVYKQAIVDSSETGTVHGTVFDHGWPDAPHRTLHNHTVDLALAGDLDADDVLGTTEDGQPVRRFSEDEPLEGWSGDIDQMCLYAGQSCGLVHDIPSAGELVTRLWAGAQRELSRASALHTAFSGTLAP
jgi:nitronate monooxygenase